MRIFFRVFPKIQMVPGECLFRPRKFLVQQNHIHFEIEGLGIINNSPDGTWKWYLSNFKNRERKNHSLFKLQNFKRGNAAAT